MSIVMHMGRSGHEWSSEGATVHEIVRRWAGDIVEGDVAQGGIFSHSGRVIVSSRDVFQAANAFVNAHRMRGIVSKETQADAMRRWTAFCQRFGSKS